MSVRKEEAMASLRSLDKISEELNSLSLGSPAAGGESHDGGEILADEEDEIVRFANMKRKEFKLLERVRGRVINILDGLELHTGVFSAAEQRRIVDCIYDFQEMGRKGRLRVSLIYVVQAKVVLYQPVSKYLPMIDKVYKILLETTKSTHGAWRTTSFVCQYTLDV